MAVILTMVGLDATRPINCQVGGVFSFHFVTREPDGL